MAESCSQVDSDPSTAADVAPPSDTVVKNGKRGAEEVEFVGNKKLKIVEENNCAMETQEESTSQQQNKAELPPSPKSVATTHDAKEASSSNESEQEGEDGNTSEENAKHPETPTKSVDSDPAAADVAPHTNTLVKNGKRGAEEVEVEVVGNKKQKVVEENNFAMETEEESTSHQQNKAALPPSPKSIATTHDAKEASSSNESGQEGEDGNTSKENAKHPETPKKSVEVPPAATREDDAERASISSEYEEEDSTKEHLESPKTSALTPNNEMLPDHPTNLDLATERDEQHPPHDTNLKTLFLGNLSFAIEEDDVRDFFKNVGEIAELRFAIKDDRFKGYGYIEFTTAEAAQEALKLNDELLLDRHVKLAFARRQRGAYTPVNNSMDKSNQRRGHGQGKTVYVRGFECSDGFDNIKSALEKHFGKCGEILRLDIPKDYATRAPKGIAFIEFTESSGVSQALRLDGSEVGGSRLTVEEAKKPKWDVREGSGYGGGGWSGSGAGWSGSSGGWVGSGGSWKGSNGGSGGSSAGWSGSGGSWKGSNGGSGGSGGGGSGSWGGSGGSWVRESGYGTGSGSSGGWRRESGYGSRSNTESGSGGGWGRESGYGSRSNSDSWHRGGGLRRESGYGRSGFGNRSHREIGSGGGWHKEGGYGGWGWEGGSSYSGSRGRGRGLNDARFSVGRGSGSSSHHGGGGRGGGSRRSSGP